RRDAVVSRRFPQRLCLEFVEHGDRGLVVAAATPAQDGKVRVKSIHCRAGRVVSPTIGLRRSGSTIRRRLVVWLGVAAWRRAPSFATGDANSITSTRFDDLNPASSPILSWSAVLARAALASCRELPGSGI